MKKTFYSFLFVIIWISMKTDPPIEYTILAYGTPYRNLPQVMKGKIKSVSEKYYWAVPDGQSYKRGTSLTRADRNSLLWSDDFEIHFSPDGRIQSCNDFDDSGNLIRDKLGKRNSREMGRAYQCFMEDSRSRSRVCFSNRMGRQTFYC